MMAVDESASLQVICLHCPRQESCAVSWARVQQQWPTNSVAGPKKLSPQLKQTQTKKSQKKKAKKKTAESATGFGIKAPATEVVSQKSEVMKRYSGPTYWNYNSSEDAAQSDETISKDKFLWFANSLKYEDRKVLDLPTKGDLKDNWWRKLAELVCKAIGCESLDAVLLFLLYKNGSPEPRAAFYCRTAVLLQVSFSLKPLTSIS